MLGDHVNVIILKVLGDAGNEGDADRKAEEAAYAQNELAHGILVELGGVAIDDQAKNIGIEQRKCLIDGG